jgi:hypothetical protein
MINFYDLEGSTYNNDVVDFSFGPNFKKVLNHDSTPRRVVPDEVTQEPV